MSDEETKLTPAERVRAVEERTQKKADAIAKARAEQYATDREKIAELEDQRGEKLHHSKQIRTYVPGAPVVVGIRAPSSGEYKRLFSKMNRKDVSGDAKVAAHVELAEACWVYPEDRAHREAMINANGGLLASVGNFANKLAEVEVEEEGKE